MPTYATKVNRRESSKARANDRSKNRSKTWANRNLKYTHSQEFDDECNDEYDLICSEWRDCLEKVLENRIKENYTCCCCGSLVCDYFDEFGAANELMRKNREAKRQNKPITFSCDGSEL